MTVTDLLSLCAGLALFLFGMSLMGAALERRAGNRLKTILSKLTSSPLKGFLLGLGVTAVIQSSSATTVMVVGFVNSGVMKLSQSVNIIIGANVGTAVTAWILSLTGLEGSEWYITIFKPTTFMPIVAIIGIAMYMFGKDNRRKDTASVMLGFTVLMYGMETMSSAVKPLAQVPEFTQILTMFSNPILGVLAGAVLTAIIQSSSASVGILQALSLTGTISYASAIPIIMGQNIGTCVTALISSAGANTEAKRASMIHLYFNVIGTVVVLIGFYAANAIFQFAFTQYHATPLGIAIVHTAFKLICTVLLMPFGKQLEELACMTVKEKQENEEFALLDERLFVTPAVAVQYARNVAQSMASLSCGALVDALMLINGYDEKAARKIEDAENRADVYEDKLGTYLVKLSAQSMSEADSHELTKLLHMIGDFERISDHAVNLVESAREMSDKQLTFSAGAVSELTVMNDAVKEVLSLAGAAFANNDIESAMRVEPLEQTIDLLQKQIRGRHIERLKKGDCTIEQGFVLSDILTNLERVSDHCSNIAACVIEIAHNALDMHTYSDLKKHENTFTRDFTGYTRKYELPEITGATK